MYPISIICKTHDYLTISFDSHQIAVYSLGSFRCCLMCWNLSDIDTFVICFTFKFSTLVGKNLQSTLHAFGIGLDYAVSVSHAAYW